MGMKTVRWGEGGKLLLRCVMDDDVYRLITEQVRVFLEHFPQSLPSTFQVMAWLLPSSPRCRVCRRMRP